MTTNRMRVILLLAGLLLALNVGCGARNTATPTDIAASATPAPAQETNTPAPTLTPSATAVPVAIQVNGQWISQAAFDVDITLLQQAQQTLGKTATPDEQRQRVTDQWIDTLLLQAAALENGFSVDETALQAEMDRLAAARGGGQNLADWMAENGYSDATFREVLRAQMMAAWQRDQLAAEVPLATEQVRARQILTLDEESANLALSQVQTPGVNFAAQAFRYDPTTGGDLGWFPRGYLTQPEVEEAAFALQPGEYSAVIRSEIGYHIIQVISREPSKALSPDALRVLREKAVQDWLAQQRAAAKIAITPAGD